MPQILSTRGISNSLEQIIKEAKEHIVLVTPYMKMPKPIYNRLMQADKNGIEISIIYRTDKLNKHHEKMLQKLVNCNLYARDNLHAKVYYNEQSLVLTSMNIYEYSEVNNAELGVLFSSWADQDQYKQLCDEVILILEDAELTKRSKANGQIHQDNIYIEKIINSPEDCFIKDYPIEGVDAKQKYGFLSYHINRLEAGPNELRQRFFESFEKAIGNKYQFFWNNRNMTLSIYKQTTHFPKTKSTQKAYKRKALETLNTLIRENFT